MLYSFWQNWILLFNSLSLYYFFENSQTNLYPKRKSTEKSETISTPPSSNLSSRNRVLEASHDVLHITCCWRHIFSNYHLLINLWILFLNHPPPNYQNSKLFNLQTKKLYKIIISKFICIYYCVPSHPSPTTQKQREKEEFLIVNTADLINYQFIQSLLLACCRFLLLRT